MKGPAQFFRMLHISYVLLKHGLDEVVFALHLFRPLSFLLVFSPSRYFYRKKPRGVRVREALEELGPIFVKFGQVLSTRFDLLPEDILKELVKLQDQVPPFSGSLAKKFVESALNQPIEENFLTFELEPLASASIAQVHAAELLDGRKVVVKILRPKIHKIIARDVSLLKTLANISYRTWKPIRQFKPKEIISEFEKALTWELDLMREAANASQLRRNFKDSELLYIPEIYWPLTKQTILVMERIYGIPISNFEALKQQGFNFKKLAEQGVEIFFTQVFRDCFFHADMHPGNILVSTHNIEQPQFIAVDFGIMGTLGPKDQRYLAENFLAFFKRDYRRVAELHMESGWVPQHIRLDEFEASIRTVCEPIFERPIKDISFGKMLFRLFQTAKNFAVEIQPQLVLLQKTLISVEGLGRQLYPELDLWQTAKPFLENWMKTQIGPKAIFQQVKKNLPYWLEKLPELPDLLYQNLLSDKAKASDLQKEKIQLTVNKSKTPSFLWPFFFGMLMGVTGVLAYGVFITK